MVDFKDFPLRGEGPVYVRIVRYIRAGVAAGTIRDGEEMPSRRVLSALLGVNPNTVQKAYRMLEEEGLMVSRSGAKSCARATPELVEQAKKALQAQEVAGAVAALFRGGMGKDEALELISRMWDELSESEGGEEA